MLFNIEPIICGNVTEMQMQFDNTSLLTIERKLLPGREGITHGSKVRRGILSFGWKRTRRMYFSANINVWRLYWSRMDSTLSLWSIQQIRCWRWCHMRSFSVSPIYSKWVKWSWYPFYYSYLDSFIPHLQLFNYILEGYLLFTGFDYQLREELQNCFVSLPSYKSYTVSISDCLYLAEVISHDNWLWIVSITWERS